MTMLFSAPVIISTACTVTVLFGSTSTDTLIYPLTTGGIPSSCRLSLNKEQSFAREPETS